MKRFVAFDKFFQLTDDELLELVRTDRVYLNRIIRQRIYLLEALGIIGILVISAVGIWGLIQV